MGGEIVIEQSFEQGETDFRTQWQNIKNANVEAVFCTIISIGSSHITYTT